MELALDQAVAYAKSIHRNGEVEKAMPIYRQVLAKDTGHVEALTFMGVACWQMKMLDQAQYYLERAVELNPQSLTALANLGNVMSDLGELDRALECFSQVIFLKPNLAVSHYNRGNALKGLNRLDEAVESYERAIALTSDVLVAAPKQGREARKIRADSIDGLLTALYLQGARRKLMTQFQKFTKELCDEEDAEFDTHYIAGLDATMTAPSPMRRRDRFRFLLKQFESTIGLAGLVAECGCYRGLSSYLLCNRLRQYDTAFNGAGYQVFDSFAGLSSPGGMDAVVHGETESIQRPGNNLVLAGNFAATLEDVKKSLSVFPGIEYFPGWIPSAFPKTVKSRYRFVHVDVDLYQPTKDSFDYFWPRLVPGGMIVCDDYNWPGAEQAVKEFCRSVGVDFKVSPYGQAFFSRPLEG